MKTKVLRLALSAISVLAVVIATSTASFACPGYWVYQPKTPKCLVIED